MAGLDTGLIKRTSTRVRPNINYTTLAAGTGEISANMDYNEVSQANAVKNQQGKKQGLKINTDVYKKCGDFLKKIRESNQLLVLYAASQQIQEFAQHLESLNQFERNLQDKQYQTTHQLSNDFLKLIQNLIKAGGTDKMLHEKVLEFQIFEEQQFHEMQLINKEIYTVQPATSKAPMPDLNMKREASQQSKKLQKI